MKVKSMLGLVAFASICGCGNDRADGDGKTVNSQMNPESSQVRDKMALAGFALAHAVWKSDDETGNLLVPFSMTEVDGQRVQQVYDTGDTGTAVELGRQKLEEYRLSVDGWVFAYLATLNKETDVVVVEVWRNDGFECQVMQEYDPAGEDRPLVLTGDPIILIDGAQTDDRDLTEQLFAGIDEHEMARSYWGR